MECRVAISVFLYYTLAYSRSFFFLTQSPKCWDHWWEAPHLALYAASIKKYLFPVLYTRVLLDCQKPESPKVRASSINACCEFPRTVRLTAKAHLRNPWAPQSSGTLLKDSEWTGRQVSVDSHLPPPSNHQPVYLLLGVGSCLRTYVIGNIYSCLNSGSSQSRTKEVLPRASVDRGWSSPKAW